MQTIQRFIYSFIRARCYRCDEWFLVVRSRSLASWPTTRWMSVWKHRPRDAHGGLRQQGTSGLRKRLDPDEACLSGTDRPTDSVMRCDAMRCAVALLLDAVLRRGRIAVCWGRAEKSGLSQRADRTCPDVRRRAQCCTMVQYSAYSIAGEESVITKHVRCTSKVAPRIYRHDTYSTALRGAFPS